jgi:hypothetical protein
MQLVNYLFFATRNRKINVSSEKVEKGAMKKEYYQPLRLKNVKPAQ